MAKRKHPISEDLRQGQTIYLVCRDWSKGPEAPPRIDRICLFSHKTPLPPPHYEITEMPVSYMKKVLSEYGNSDFYYSHKRALTAFKNWGEKLND